MAKIEVLADGVVVATHARLYGKKGQYSTINEHMASAWGVDANPWTPDRYLRWADGVGSATKEVIGRVLASRVIVEQSFTNCQNILGLAKTYGRKALEQACLKVCKECLAVPTYTLIKGEIVSARRRSEETSLVHIENPAGDKMKGKGRARGAEHYRIKGGVE